MGNIYPFKMAEMSDPEEELIDVGIIVAIDLIDVATVLVHINLY